MGTKKKTVNGITKEELIAIANELNAHPDDGGVVGFEPAIDVKLPLSKLGAELLRKCNGVAVDDDGNESDDPDEGLRPSDPLSDDAWRVCAAIGNAVAINVMKSREKKAPKAEKKAATTEGKPKNKRGDRTVSFAAVMKKKKQLTIDEIFDEMQKVSDVHLSKSIHYAISYALPALVALGFATINDKKQYKLA